MERVLKACLNWRVIGGLTATGLGIWLLAPHLLVAAVPFLFVAVCPLSMLLMMGSMTSGRDPAAREPGANEDHSVGEPVDLQDLRTRLEDVQRQHKALELEIDKLESATGERPLSAR